MVSWWGRYSYFNHEKFKLVILNLLMLHMVYQDLLNQELGQNLLDRTHIEVEEVISVQTQHQYMDQFIKLI